MRTLCTNSTSDGASDGNGSGKCFRCTVSDVNSDETRWGSKDLEGWNRKHVPLLQHMTPAWASPMRPGNGSWKETDRRPDAQADAFPVSNLISENPQTIPTRRCDPTWGNTSLYFSLLLAAVLLGRGRGRLALAGRPCRRAGAGREGMYRKMAVSVRMAQPNAQ